MKSTTPFDVVLVPFPFSDKAAAKQRPCLVLASVRPTRLPEHVVVCMMTSQTNGLAFPFDCAVVNTAKAGLPKPTIVRVSKLVTIDSTLIRKRLGSLATEDAEAVKEQLDALFFQASPLAQVPKRPSRRSRR